MTRKDLQEKYNIIGDNKNICLYRKRGEYFRGLGYCGNISLNNGKAEFNGKKYTDLDSLDNALLDWEKSLKYPVDSYNPMMRENYRTESRIIWYLEEKLGFKSARGPYTYNKYVKNIGPNCQLSFAIENEDERINIISRYGDVSFAIVAEDADEAIEGIDSIISCSVLEMSHDMIDLLSICKESVSTGVKAYIESNKNILGFEKVDFKTLMIERLERQLKMLKGEE